MPKIESKEEAIRQVTHLAIMLRKLLDEKLGDWKETTVGRGEIEALMKKKGERAKDVISTALKKFGVKKFSDPEGEVLFIIEDYKKPVLRARKVRP